MRKAGRVAFGLGRGLWRHITRGKPDHVARIMGFPALGKTVAVIETVRVVVAVQRVWAVPKKTFHAGRSRGSGWASTRRRQGPRGSLTYIYRIAVPTLPTFLTLPQNGARLPGFLPGQPGPNGGDDGGRWVVESLSAKPKGLAYPSPGFVEPWVLSVATTLIAEPQGGSAPLDRAMITRDSADTEPRWGSGLKRRCSHSGFQGSLAKARQPFARLRKALGLRSITAFTSFG